MNRCFLGLSVPPTVRTSLITAQAHLSELEPPLPSPPRLTSEANFHLTLKFLGATTDAQLQTLSNELPSFGHALNLPSITVQGVGAFPNPEGPKSLFASIGAGSESLVSLGSKVDQLCAPIGFKPETRPRVPHITLARLRAAPPDPERGGVHAWLAHFKNTPFGLLTDPQTPGTTSETTLVLYRSELQAIGATYERLCCAPLVLDRQ